MPKSTATYFGCCGFGHVDEDVAGVHVGVKEVVAEHLREEDLDAVLREPLDVRAGAAQRLDVVDLDAEDALHRQHVRAAKIPMDLGHVQQVGAGEIALELRGVRGFAHQIELDGERPLELRDDLDGMEPMRLGPVALREPGDRVQHLDVALDQRRDVRPQDLHDDGLAAREARRVHLRDRGRRERLARRIRRTLARRAGRRRRVRAAAACSAANGGT